MQGRWIAAALLALAAGSVRAAEKVDFERCDGFKMPSGSSDGFAVPRPQYDFLLPGQPMGQRELGERKVAACTAALDDARLLPEHLLRRVHLLRARALAELQSGDPAAALADVDRAEAAARPLAADPLYGRSLGLSLQMVRAAAWQLRADPGEVRRLTGAIARERPYSTVVQSITVAIERGTDAAAGRRADPAIYLKLLPLLPGARMLQFEADVEAGQFAEAARLYPLLDTRYPRILTNTAFVPDAIAQRDQLLAALSADWNAAYVFAALGDPARSLGIEAKARAKLDEALAPIPPRKAGALPEPIAMKAPLETAVGRLATMAAARRAIAAHHPADALKALIGTELPPNPLSLELLTALRDALPREQAALAPDPAAMAARIEANRKEARLNVTALAAALPPPETRLARYGGSIGGFIGGFLSLSPDGFKSKTDEATGVTTVEFVGQSTSAPVVQEMTLLRAADLARQQGKAGLLILERRDYTRTLTTTFNGMATSSRPAGFKTELKVRFVDPAALPADVAGERDRVLDANAVYAALAPIYIPPAPPPAKS